MNARAFALLACVWLAATGCGDDGGGDDAAATTQNLRCAVGEVRMCPCIGSGMGTQMCNAEGTGYSACTGCPAPAGAGGTSPMGTAGMQAPASAGRAGSGTNMGGAGGGGASGMGGAGGRAGGGSGGAAGGGSTAGSGSEPMPSSGTAPGVSCGVGLPALCALETEKCCVRSLQADTCIAASETCGCSLQGCAVMEARCDGPEDCPSGQVCCGTLSQNGAGYDRFVCAAQCMSTGNQRVACHEDMDTCDGNDICANSQLLTNVQVCIDPATIEQ